MSAGDHRADAPRVLSFVGRSGSGKTTLLEGVIGSLTERGMRVGVIKHHAHDIELDVPQKDSWRHAQAGAVATVVSGPSQFALVRRVASERTVAQLAELMAGVDIILAEGFRTASTACVEVLRAGNSSQPICPVSQLAAVVTDVPASALPTALREAISVGTVAIFALDDIAAVTEAIVDGRLAGMVVS